MTSYFQQALSSFQETFELKGEVGRMVDEATAEDLMVADVNTNRAICRKCADMSTECGSALRVIRSRLQHRSPKVQLLALQLLSEIVCKSGREAHAQVSEKDGPLSDLKHLAVAPGTEAAVRKKALLLIRAWGDTPDGGGNGGAETRLFRETYNSLVSQGISFPAFDASLAPGRDSPVSRPVSSIPQHSALTASPTRGHGQPARNPGGGGGYGGPARELDPLGSWVPNTAGPGGGLPGGRFDVKRLEEDLEDASMQAMVLSDTLESLDPSMRDPCASSSVVRELARNCRIFQTRLSKLAEEVSDERAIPLIFQTNDEVIRALAALDEFPRSKQIKTNQSKSSAGAPGPRESVAAGSIQDPSWGIPGEHGAHARGSAQRAADAADARHAQSVVEGGAEAGTRDELYDFDAPIEPLAAPPKLGAAKPVSGAGGGGAKGSGGDDVDDLLGLMD